MKRNLALIPFAFVLLLSLNQAAFSQKSPMKYGKIVPEELKMTVYSQDTNASAVVLGDFGKSYFEYSEQDGFQIKFEHHTRIKIFNKNGYEWANVRIPLYHDMTSREKLTSVKASTYNFDEKGKIAETSMKKNAVFTEESSSNWDNCKFTLPGIADGCIIEYEYTIISDFMFNLRGWQFQSAIPIIWSEYMVTIPEYFTYNLSSRGYEPFFINEKTRVPGSINYTVKTETQEGYAVNRTSQIETINFQSNRYRLVTQNVPALVEEPYMTTINNYFTSIEFELANIQYPNSARKDYTQTWEAINELLIEDEDFGLQLNRKGFISETVESLISGINNPREKMRVIYDYTKTHYKWNNEKSKYVTTNIKEAYDKGTGNVADINLALAVMLRQAGLNAEPAILSTRDNGILHPAHPSLTQFNYVIVAVNINDTSYLLDATEPLCPANLLPYRCLNFNSRIISEKGSKDLDIKPNNKYSETVIAELKITPDGTVAGSYIIDLDGYAALNRRKEITAEVNIQDYIEKLQNDHPGLTVTKYSFENLDNVYSSLRFNSEITLTGLAQGFSDRIYLNPMLIDQEKINPFKLEERKFPVDFGHPFEINYVVRIEVPEEYEAEEMPENANVTLPNSGGKFIYNITKTGNIYQLTSKYTVDRTLFLPGEYPVIKEYFNQIVTKQSQQIVLVRKNQ
ncbi:MAG: DUF3857 domain-containing protein [Bacteroidetes bacterium]|nr:DUF3857 domain-containing protein [Bacteroidota bacterium]